MKIGFLITLSENDVNVLLGKVPYKKRQSFLLDLVSYYANRGHNVTIITFSDIQQDTTFQLNDNIMTYVVNRINHGRIRAFLNFSLEINKVKKILKQVHCDVIHSQWCYEMAKSALDVLPSKTIITLHDWPDAVCPLIGNYYWRKRQKLGNYVLAKGHIFTGVSPYIVNLYREKYTGRISLIPNFISNDIIFQEPNIEDNHRLGKIISINNGFNNIKNTKKLIRAFALIKKQYPNSELHLYGSEYEVNGPAYKWTAMYASLEGITFYGPRNRADIIQALREVELLIHPSIEESFGMILIEAMANKVAVIAGKESGAVPWILRNGEYGLLVNIKSEKDIAEAAFKYFRDRSLKNKIKESAFEYVQTTYSLNVVAEEYLQLYKSIITSNL